jgi:hypothetical protein
LVGAALSPSATNERRRAAGTGTGAGRSSPTPTLRPARRAEVGESADPGASGGGGGDGTDGLGGGGVVRRAALASEASSRPPLELSGCGLRGAEVKRAPPPFTRAPPPTPPPADLSWLAERPAITPLEAALSGGAEGSAPSPLVEYVRISSRLSPEPGAAEGGSRTPPHLEPRPAAAGTSVPSMLPLGRAHAAAEPIAPSRRELRPSASAGAMGAGAAAERERELLTGSCTGWREGTSPYLERLPPVLRRSVCGTGARQHTRAVFAGERERDGTARP